MVAAIFQTIRPILAKGLQTKNNLLYFLLSSRNANDVVDNFRLSERSSKPRDLPEENAERGSTIHAYRGRFEDSELVLDQRKV